MTAPFRFPRFFVTTPTPCPYLPGRIERKVFTELTGPDVGELNDALAGIGFRRSQNVAYRPSCVNCAECVSVRVLANEFVPGATHRRLLKRHADLEVSACSPWSTEEQYALMLRYLDARHASGGMAGMDDLDFAEMVEHSPVDTYVLEYREPSVHGRPGRLVGASITDRQGDGLSMVYSFFAPADEGRAGLGTFIILDHIRRAAENGLAHVYLGYWVRGSRRMEYKARFGPMERLTPAGWVRMTDADTQAAILHEGADGAPLAAKI